MDKNLIKHALWSSWKQETAHSSVVNTWNKCNRSVGQCAITSLLIQEILGGEIIKASISGKNYTHYWNKINGEYIDFTDKQFGEKVDFFDLKIKTREEIISNVDTLKRYLILKTNFENFLKNFHELNQKISLCRKCQNVSYFEHDSIFLGNDCNILMIGEAPAKNGWRITGKAWINEKGQIIPSGKILQKLLEIIGKNLHDITFIEGIKCLPDDRKHLIELGNNCKSFLYKQIELLEPNILITLGDFPTRNILGNTYKKFSDIVGKEQKISIGNDDFILIPTYHPSPISPLAYQGNEAIYQYIKTLI